MDIKPDTPCLICGELLIDFQGTMVHALGAAAFERCSVLREFKEGQAIDLAERERGKRQFITMLPSLLELLSNKELQNKLSAHGKRIDYQEITNAIMEACNYSSSSQIITENIPARY